ncbi:hypothetical protein, partial [Gallibacterium anatis]|uniref:hypothetical protein n=1 Tax=Gallibacterium anatis TaxID=750 RepID=UPI001E55E134
WITTDWMERRLRSPFLLLLFNLLIFTANKNMNKHFLCFNGSYFYANSKEHRQNTAVINGKKFSH